MICKFSIKNYKTFANETKLDFLANGNIKRFDYNYYNVNNNKILKTAGIYGPNNTGKSCLLSAVAAIKTIMLNEQHDNFSNAFIKNNEITSLNVEYYINDRFYQYSVSYNNVSKIYEKEKLIKINYNDQDIKKDIIFEKNTKSLSWKNMDLSFSNINFAKIFSPFFPFMIMFQDDNNKAMKQAKEDYLTFANSLLFLKMDGPVDISKTLSLMETDPKAQKFIKEFVKNCDLHIDDFGFDNNIISDTNIDDKMKQAMNMPSFIKDVLKFYSKHNGYRVPSFFFDSVGTQKLIALAGYIYDALHNGKTLIVDEIDSSLHHIITKSIVAMFNNILNVKSQLIFATHDVMLLDLKTLFRKDQIWLVDIDDNKNNIVNRLSDFTSRSENGIRGDEDITNHYLKGQFGSIPTPDLFTSLEEAINIE